MELEQNPLMLSPEDVAWADSCFVKDPEISDSGWDCLKYALLETLDDSSFYGRENSSEAANMMEIHSSEDKRDTSSSNKTGVRVTVTSDGSTPTSDDHSHQENADDFWSSHKMEDVFLPTYNENMRDLGVSDPELDFIFQEYKLELSTEDIFKTWDLDIPPEEDDDDTMKQLTKALAENSSEPTISVPDDSKAWKELQDESLDDLITGIADLKLSPNSV